MQGGTMLLKLDPEHVKKCTKTLERARARRLKQNKRYYKDNKAHLAEYRRKYYTENKDACLKRQNDYYARNKEACSAYYKQYYAENTEKIAAKDKRYRASNKEACSARTKKYYAENKEKIAVKDKLYRENNKEMLKKQWKDKMKNPQFYKKKKITSAKMRAKDLKVPFDLTFEGIDWPTHCPVFGTLLVYAPAKTSSINKPSIPSIDRIDSTKGYTVDNVQVISMLANAMKNSASAAELKMFAEWVLAS